MLGAILSPWMGWTTFKVEHRTGFLHMIQVHTVHNVDYLSSCRTLYCMSKAEQTLLKLFLRLLNFAGKYKTIFVFNKMNLAQN